MPEAIIGSHGQITLKGLTTRAAEENRLAIASDIERLGPEGSAQIAESLREAGPTVSVERIDIPSVVRAWLGHEWCAWALPGGGNSPLDEFDVCVSRAGRIGAVIAAIVGLEPGPERSADDKSLVFRDEGLAVWCAAQGVSHWRVRITANSETGESSCFEAAHHPSLGWFVAFRDPAGVGSALSLSPTSARFLWRLLLSLLGSALPTIVD
jgi:hypothetical protein